MGKITQCIIGLLLWYVDHHLVQLQLKQNHLMAIFVVSSISQWWFNQWDRWQCRSGHQTNIFIKHYCWAQNKAALVYTMVIMLSMLTASLSCQKYLFWCKLHDIPRIKWILASNAFLWATRKSENHLYQ